MQAVILAGGLGTRISEETSVKPKPMVEIGGKPIIWHIMKIYEAHGINDFIICCGYKGSIIKEYFKNYSIYNSDVTVCTKTDELIVHDRRVEEWKITLVDTGESSMTGGRLKRVKHYLRDDEPFCLTYGDGVGDIDVSATIAYHTAHGKLATVTAVMPPARFGMLEVDQKGSVKNFDEKPVGGGSLINGGFFVLEKCVLEYISGDTTVWEKQPLQRLALDGQLMAFEHKGFWQPMDTLRDKINLEQLWENGNAPWDIWS